MTTNGSADTPRRTPPSPASRQSELSIRLLSWLERLPKVADFLSVLIITLGILMTPGVAGAVLTLALAAGAGLFIYATWARKLPASMRIARCAIPVALAVLGVIKLFL